MVQYRKGKSSPWVSQVRDRAGKVQTASFAVREDAEKFENAEKEKRRLLKRGLRAPREKILFYDFARDWLEKRYRSMGKSTVNQDNSRLRNYWMPLLSSYPIETIQSPILLKELDRIQFKLGHSPADRNRHRALLHKLFTDAFMEDKIDVNPVSRIPLVEESKKTRRPSVLKPGEPEIYLTAMYEEGPQYGMLAELMIWTGARVCSANVIRYEDVDTETGVIRIRRLEERASRTVVNRQKGTGEGGETIVPLFPRLRAAIEIHRRRSYHPRDSDYIACQPGGRYIPYDTIRGVHERALKTSKVTQITIHDLRRTFATFAERAGYSKAEIREMLGHSTVLVTEKYTMKDISHLVEKGKRIGFGQDDQAENVIKLGGKHVDRGE